MSPWAVGHALSGACGRAAHGTCTGRGGGGGGAAEGLQRPVRRRMHWRHQGESHVLWCGGGGMLDDTLCVKPSGASVGTWVAGDLSKITISCGTTSNVLYFSGNDLYVACSGQAGVFCLGGGVRWNGLGSHCTHHAPPHLIAPHHTPSHPIAPDHTPHTPSHPIAPHSKP